MRFLAIALLLLFLSRVSFAQTEDLNIRKPVGNNNAGNVGYGMLLPVEPAAKNPRPFSEQRGTPDAVAAPGNDLCGNATNMGTATNTTLTLSSETNVGATTSAGDPTPSCWVFGVNSTVWYKFTMTAAGYVTINLTHNTIQYAAITAYSGSCGAMTQVGCSDPNTSTANPSLVGCLSAGTYYIEVWDDAGVDGSYSLSVSATNLSNDACASATSMGGFTTTNNSSANTVTYSVSTTGSNQCASADQASPSCYTANANVWYTFTAPVAGNYFVSVKGGTISYPAVAVWTGSCGALTLQSCAGVTSGCLGSYAYTSQPYGYSSSNYAYAGACSLTAGQTVHVSVDSWNCGGTGTFTVTAMCLSNDGIPAAGIIATCGVSFSSSTMGATNCGDCNGSSGGWAYANVDCNNATTNNATTCGGCPGTGGDVDYSVEDDSWYQVCTTTAQTYSLTITPNTCYVGSGVQASIFTGSAGNLTWLTGTPHAGITVATTYTFALAANQCIYIQTDGLSGSLCDYSLLLNTSPGCPLPLELYAFKGENINNSEIKLGWDLGSEKDITAYVVERSSNGIDYSTLVGRVLSAGNTNKPGSYSVYDVHPLDGNNYYQLSAIDKNGVQNVAAHTLVTNRAHLPNFTIYPNPSNGTLNINLINFSSPVVTVDIYDMYGKQVWTSDLNLDNGNSIQQLDLSNFANGVYFVKANDGTTLYKKSLIIAKGNN